MHVNELCKWLENNSMLEMDQNGMAGLRKNTHGSTFTPPSLSNIVRTHIDQLSPRLGTVLRHASIMGMTFYEGLLFKLISTELSLTQESLSSHLRALAAAGFLLQMTDEHGYPIQLWKVCKQGPARL